MKSRLLIIPIIFLLAACGKKGALLYPEMLAPAKVSSLAALQSGSAVKLSFLLPTKDLAGHSLNTIAGVNVFKRIESSLTEPDCSACLEDFRLLRTIYTDLPGDAVQLSGNSIIFVDADTSRDTAYSYYVVSFAKDGTKGAVSAPVRVKVVHPYPAPALQVSSEPTEIILRFIPRSPVYKGLVGYNLYRSLKGEDMPLKPLNAEIMNSDSYVDNRLDRSKTYRYQLRAVIEKGSGERVESLASDEVYAECKNYDE